MTVQYVVSISGELRYFDAERRPTSELARDDEGVDRKPSLKLIPVEEKPAARPEWDEALAEFTRDQRLSAEISEVVAH